MTGERPAIFDPGLQPERAALAWRRTALALMVGPLVGVRLLAPTHEGLAVLAGLLGTFGALAILLGARSRDRRVLRALTVQGAAPLPGAGLLLLVVAGLTLGGVAAVVLAVLNVRQGG